MAVPIVVVYLALNAVLIGWGLQHLVRHPELLSSWTTAVAGSHGNPFMMVLFVLLLFPKLALGLSGFETGVAIMPLVRGEARRHRGTPDRAGSATPTSCSPPPR